MAPASPRLRVLSVGGNPLSAFLSWRLQATQACDVTLVWKAGYEAVAQYGISFKSSKFGNERFKPHHVVRTPEEAGTLSGGFDYVLLSVKALPDVYDLASIIESVVTPQHTCILLNTTTALGTETYLESRYPTNVILSLVSGVNLNQLGTSEFEHAGGTDLWVGSAIDNANVPQAIQLDMAEALALTLASGNIDCHVSPNIRQQQWERVLGSIAFHPLSVIMDTPSLSALMEKPGCKELIMDLIDELLVIARAQNCAFADDFKQKIIDDQLKAPTSANIMHQDFVARRPLEVETLLGSPIKAGKMTSVKTPHLDTLYAVLHHLNQQNQTKPPSPSAPPPNNSRPMQSQPPPRSGAGSRRPTPGREGLDPSARRRPPPAHNGILPPNGHGPRTNGDFTPRAPSAAVSRRNSFDNDLEEFGHIALYGDAVDGDAPPGMVPNPNELSMREREIVLREREAMLREQELNMRGGPGGRKNGGRRRMFRTRSMYGGDDDDEEEVYIDAQPPPVPPIDVDNFDMMSVTSRRNRRLPSTGNMRNPGSEIPMQPQAPQPSRGRHSMFNRPGAGPRSRTSTRLMSDVPGLHDSITDNALMGYASNRYGAVDRKMMTDTSRANSMTSGMGDTYSPVPNGAYPPMPMPNGRRMSASPGDMRPNGYGPRPGNSPDQRSYRGPSDAQPLRQPVPKYPPGQGLPQQVEQHVTEGVSQTHVLKGPPNNNVRSTTGSASASFNDSGSGSSGDQSAYSSTSSLEKRMPRVAVR